MSGKNFCCLCFSGKKKDNDLAAALSRAAGLEAQLNKSEASLSTALSQNAGLTSDLADLKSQLAKVCTIYNLNHSVDKKNCNDTF